jgi:hypothetical protein
MARPKGSGKKQQEVNAKIEGLLSVLRFVGSATKQIGEPNTQHFYIGEQWCIGHDGIVEIGSPIADDLKACPNAAHLIDAVARCKGVLNITQLDNNRISVKGEKLRVTIPCLDPSAFVVLPPDNPVANIDERLRVAFKAVAPIASDNAQSVVAASVLLRSGSVVATDRSVMLEYWHGIDLPELAIPKHFLSVLLKTEKKFAKFGFSANSATFWFEDGSFMRTQLYSEPWPDSWSGIMSSDASQAVPIPAGFWEAFDAVAPFSEDGFVYFRKDKLASSDNEAIGAEHDCPGVPAGPAIAVKRAKWVAPYAKVIDFSRDNKMDFFGENVRGTVAVDVVKDTPTETSAPAAPTVAPPPSIAGEPQSSYPTVSHEQAAALGFDSDIPPP